MSMSFTRYNSLSPSSFTMCKLKYPFIKYVVSSLPTGGLQVILQQSTQLIVSDGRGPTEDRRWKHHSGIWVHLF